MISPKGEIIMLEVDDYIPCLMNDAKGDKPSGNKSIPASRGRKAADVEDYDTLFRKVESWLVDSGVRE